jgi:MFS family permease
VLLFAAAWGANHFVPLLLVYRERLQLSATDLGVLFGAYALGLVPGLLLGGPLSDRYGRRAVVLPSALVVLAGTSLLAGAADFPLLLAGRLVVGAGCGATFSAGTAWVQDLAKGAPEGAGARRAAVALSSGFGGGPLVTSIVAQWLPRPMLTPYFVHALILIGAGILAWPASDEMTRVRSRDLDVGESVLPPGFFRQIAPVAPWVFAFPSISFAVLPGLVRERLGRLAIAYAGLVTATTLFAGVLAQPFMRRMRPRDAALWGLGLGAVGLLAGLFATAHGWPAGVLVAAILLGVGYGACLVAGLRWIEAATSLRTRGRVIGVFYVCTYLGFMAPWLLAALARVASDAAGLVGATVLALATVAYTARRPWLGDAVK